MGDKKQILKEERFKTDKQWFIRCLMTRIHTETHNNGCVNFDKISAIIGEDINDGVFSPGFFDYIRLGFSLIWTAFHPCRRHRHIILGRRVNLSARLRAETL